MNLPFAKEKSQQGFDWGTLMLSGSLGVFFAVVLFSVILMIFSDGFLTTANLFTTARTFSLWIVVGFAQMMVLVIGDLNLSVGAIGGLSAVLVGYLFQNAGSPVWVGIIAALLIGILCGGVNGLLINKTGINAFVVTLGTSSVFLGINYGVTKALPFSTVPAAMNYIGRARVLGSLPILFFVMLFVAMILYVLFVHTVLGRRILATGGNKEAAELAGINTKGIVLLVHVLSGLLAGLAGVLFVARLGAAHPTIGQNWMLTSFAVPIIGGTSLQGGVTSIIGVVLGGILITLITNGLILLQVDIFWEQFFLGLLLLIAVGVDRARRVYAEKRFY